MILQGCLVAARLQDLYEQGYCQTIFAPHRWDFRLTCGRLSLLYRKDSPGKKQDARIIL